MDAIHCLFEGFQFTASWKIEYLVDFEKYFVLFFVLIFYLN